MEMADQSRKNADPTVAAVARMWAVVEKQTGRRRRLAATGTAIAVGSVLAIAGVSAASYATLSSNGDDEWHSETAGTQQKAQLEAMRELADAIAVQIDLSDEGTNSAGEGFGGMSISDDGQSLELYWKGDMSVEVSTVIAAHSDVNCSIQRAAYSLAELVEAAGRVEAAIGWDSSKSVYLIALGPAANGSGISVDAASGSPDVPPEEVASRVEKAAGVPVEIHVQKYGESTLQITW
jgi:hypothetical protein